MKEDNPVWKYLEVT